MACASSCKTQDHATWGECIRSQGQMIGYANSANGQDLTAQKKLDSELAFYRQARAEGIQPSGTSRAAVETAMAISDKSGVAFDAS